jgi:hypothetical protein
MTIFCVSVQNTSTRMRGVLVEHFAWPCFCSGEIIASRRQLLVPLGKKSDLQVGLQSNVIIVLRNIFQYSICKIEETTEHR